MADFGTIKIATNEDFDGFIKAGQTEENWNLCYQEGELKVWDQKSDASAVNIVKLYAVFPDLNPWVLYDVLHDPEYRAVWDENMIEGYNIEQLDANNDVGYYSAKAPATIANRDFVNQRSWRVQDDKEFVIMNHSVVHPKAPEKKGFVRANSIRTGYMVNAKDAGCTLTYLTQTDPRGWIPTFLVNKVTKTFAPKIIDKLHNAAVKYTEWKNAHKPENKPWRNGAGPN